MGWRDVEILRCPSGDGAIIAFFGGGVDAASMVEPYATMLVRAGLGRVVKRTGDVWPGAPGCSLTASRELVESRPELVEAVVAEFAGAVADVRRHPREAAAVARPHIGIDEETIAQAIAEQPPLLDAIRNDAAMTDILAFMVKLGYMRQAPKDYRELSFLDRAASRA